jgi:soluble lytic murein transglycosylase-like protein
MALALALAVALQPEPSSPEQEAVLPVAAPIVVNVSPDSARRRAVAQAAVKFGVEVNLALAVSRVENWSGDNTAVSKTGCCLGIMQVDTALHTGRYTECEDITTVMGNACYGVAVLRDALSVCNGDWRCAVRKYGGWEAQWADPQRARRYVAQIAQLRRQYQSAAGG